MSRYQQYHTIYLGVILYLTFFPLQYWTVLGDPLVDNSSNVRILNQQSLTTIDDGKNLQNFTTPPLVVRRIGTTAKPILACYFTGWDQWKQQPYKFLSSSVDPFLCTHIIYAFSKISHNWKVDIYEHNAHEQYRELVALRNVNPDLKILLAIGGWTHGGQSFTKMAADSAKRKIFVEDVVEQLLHFELDGFDIDWEYPGSKERGSKPEDKKNFVLLLKELRYAFDVCDRELLLTAAVAAGKANIENGYNIPEVNKYVDYLNLLSYDFHGAWDPVTGINSPYASNESTLSMTWAADYWVAHGADPNKLVIGLATYGRAFTLKQQQPYNHSLGAPIRGPGKAGRFTLEPGVLAYYEICRHLKVDNWKKKWDPSARAPYAYKDDQWVGYENKKSLGIKVDFANENCFAGVMVWDLALDDHKGINCGQGKYPLISFIKSKLAPDQWTQRCPRKSIIDTTTATLTSLSPSFETSPITMTISTVAPSTIPETITTLQETSATLPQITATVWSVPNITDLVTTLTPETEITTITTSSLASSTFTTLLPRINDTASAKECELWRAKGYVCESEGSFMDKYSCGQYYECVKNSLTGDFTQYHRSCADPHQTYFDDKTMNCAWRQNAYHLKEICPCDHEIDSVGISKITSAPGESTIMEFTKTTPSLPASDSPECRAVSEIKFKCSSAGLFIDNSDCRFYWECVYNGHANIYYEYRRACPPGNTVVFDTNIKTCVWDWQSSSYDSQHCPCNVAVDKETTLSTLAPAKVANVTEMVTILPSEIPAKGKLLFCYFTGWDQWKPHPYNFTPSSVDPFLCTHIVYAFLDLGVNFTIQNVEHNTEEQFQELNSLKKLNPSLKILAGIGGWNAGAKHFSNLAKSERNRKVFVRQAAEYLLNMSLDGLDLDWEYPGHEEQGGSSEDKANFPILLKEIRHHFDAETKKRNVSKLLLTAAVSAGELNIKNGYDVPKINQYLDYVLVMAYDMNGPWQPYAGFNSPLFDPKSDFSISWAVNYWHTMGVPLHKLIVGIPTYGRILKLRNPQLHYPGDPILGAGPPGQITGESGTLSYYEICLMVTNTSSGWITTFDTKAKVAYSHKDNLWVNYENEKSFTAKAHYILEKQYAGAMVWNLALDDHTGLACGTGKYPLISFLSSLLGIKKTQNLTSFDSPLKVRDEQHMQTTLKNEPIKAVELERKLNKSINESFIDKELDLKLSKDKLKYTDIIVSNKIEQMMMVKEPPYGLRMFLTDVLDLVTRYFGKEDGHTDRIENKRALHEIDPNGFGNKIIDITNLNLLTYLKENLSIPEETLFTYTSQLTDPTYSPYWLNILRIIKTELSKNATILRDAKDNLASPSIDLVLHGATNQGNDGTVFYNFDDEANGNSLDSNHKNGTLGAAKILKLNGSSTYFDDKTNVDIPNISDLNVTRKLNINLGNILTHADGLLKNDHPITYNNSKSLIRIRLILPKDLNRELSESDDVLNIMRNLTIMRHDGNESKEGLTLTAIKSTGPTPNGTLKPVILSLVINKHDGTGEEDISRTLLHLSRNVYVGDETRFNQSAAAAETVFLNYTTINTKLEGDVIDLKTIIRTGKRVDNDRFGANDYQTGSSRPDEVYLNIDNYSLVLNLSSILKRVDEHIDSSSHDPVLWDAKVRLTKFTDGSDYAGKNIIKIDDYKLHNFESEDFDVKLSESPNGSGQVVHKLSVESDPNFNIPANSMTLKIENDKSKSSLTKKRSLSSYPLLHNQDKIVKNNFMKEYIKDLSYRKKADNVSNLGSSGNESKAGFEHNNKTENISEAITKCAAKTTFECDNEGGFLDKYDCRYYWRCSPVMTNGVLMTEKLHILCLEDKVYDESLKDCVETWSISNIATICKCSESLSYMQQEGKSTN